MSSSVSTPITEGDLPLWVVLSCEDNPRVCTGRRALRFGLATEVTGTHRPDRGALLLDPHSPTPLTRADARRVLGKGVVVVDCSWNKLGARGGYPTTDRWLQTMRVRRRLPLVLAANPQHFGRLGELNTAEALGCAIYMISGEPVARKFLERFSFGPSFLELNGVWLEAYRAAENPAKVTEMETRHFCGPTSLP